MPSFPGYYDVVFCLKTNPQIQLLVKSLASQGPATLETAEELAHQSLNAFCLVAVVLFPTLCMKIV
jgi:hypothetical protein